MTDTFENIPAVPKRISGALLASLAAGVVPRSGLEYIAIGRRDEIGAIVRDLELLEDGGSAFRLVTGRYGSGKSFLMQLMRANAMERGFAAADADLSPERRLSGSSGQGLATYRELMKNLAVKSSPDGGALPVVLGRWVSRVLAELAEAGGPPPGSPELAKEAARRITAQCAGFEGMVHGFDFAAAVSFGLRGFIEGDDSKKQPALKWLRGEYNTKTEAKAELPVSSIIDDASWYDYLKLAAAMVRAAGFRGLVVFIDEAVNLYKITNPISREANYEKLLHIYNDCAQGRLSSMAFVFGGTPQFVEDNRRGLYSYEALRSRLAQNRFAAGLRDFSGPVLRLESLTPEEILALLKRILNIHSRHNGWDPPVGDAELLAFLNEACGRMGAERLLTPREVVRDFVGLLNVLMQNPDTAFADLVNANPFTPADKAGEDGEDGDFAGFTV